MYLCCLQTEVDNRGVNLKEAMTMCAAKSKEKETSGDAKLAQETLEQFPREIGKALRQLRSIILSTHKNTANVGELSEVLRWGQLSYLTPTGSMIRLGMSKTGKPAMFFHCGTSLIETYRAQYSHEFEFEGNRAVVLSSSVSSTKAALAHCIEQALTYKL